MLQSSIVTKLLSSKDIWCAVYLWIKDGVEHKMYYVKTEGKLATIIVGKFSMLNIHDLDSGSVETVQIIRDKCIKGVMTREEYYSLYQEGIDEETGEIEYSDSVNGFYKSAIITKNGTALYRMKFKGTEENIHDIVLKYPEIKYLPSEIETPEGRWQLLEILRDKNKISEILAIFECRDLTVLNLQDLKERTPYNYFVKFVKGMILDK